MRTNTWIVVFSFSGFNLKIDIEELLRMVSRRRDDMTKRRRAASDGMKAKTGFRFSCFEGSISLFLGFYFTTNGQMRTNTWIVVFSFSGFNLKIDIEELLRMVSRLRDDKYDGRNEALFVFIP